MPRTLLLSTLALTGLGAVLAFGYGQRAASFDPGGVVEEVAAYHVARHGGAPTACMGWMAENGRDVKVRCAGALYRVNMAGQIRRVKEDGT